MLDITELKNKTVHLYALGFHDQLRDYLEETLTAENLSALERTHPAIYYLVSSIALELKVAVKGAPVPKRPVLTLID